MTLTRRLKRYLLTGFIVVAPISISVFLLLWFVAMVDRVVGPVVYTLVGRYVPGLGFGTAILLLVAAGWLSSNIMGQHLFDMVEDLLLHIPGLNWLYRTVKQLTEVFSPDGKVRFKSVVMVEYPRPGVYQLGFVTKTLELERDGEASVELLSIYIGTNHFYIGDIVLVPSDKVIPLDLTPQEGIQFYLSAGASTPSRIRALKYRGPSAGSERAAGLDDTEKAP